MGTEGFTAIVEKTIDTLIEDIEEVLVNGIDPDDNPDIDRAVSDFSRALAQAIRGRLVRHEREPVLRMSNIGKPCRRQLWYELNSPGDGEPLRAETYMKFLYGDLTEELVLFLARLAGHTVEGEQDEQEIEGIKGHRDVVIDGTLVDVKSASSYSFKKFKEGRLADDDAFGYISQIQSYLHAAQDDPIVTDKNRAGFLVVDKTLGHLCLDMHDRSEFDWPQFYRDQKEMVAQEEPPERAFETVPEGKSGNKKLGVNCSYCAFKNKCWPGLRTYLYSYGPVHLTKVVREPKVPLLNAREDND